MLSCTNRYRLLHCFFNLADFGFNWSALANIPSMVDSPWAQTVVSIEIHRIDTLPLSIAKDNRGFVWR
jgi:hypothetical protein